MNVKRWQWLAGLTLLCYASACAAPHAPATLLTDGCVENAGAAYAPFQIFVSACAEPRVEAARAAAQILLLSENKPAPRFTHYDFARQRAYDIPLAAYAQQHPELAINLQDTRWRYLDATHLFLSEGNSSKTQANEFLVNATTGALVWLAEARWIGANDLAKETPRFIDTARRAREIFILPDDAIALLDDARAVKYFSATSARLSALLDENKIGYQDLSQPPTNAALPPQALDGAILSPDAKYWADARGIFERATGKLLRASVIPENFASYYPAVLWRDDQTVLYGRGGMYCPKTLGFSCVDKWIPQSILALSIAPP